MYTIEFKILDLPMSLNQILASGWKKRWMHGKKWQTLVDYAVLKNGGPPEEPLQFAKIEMVRHCKAQLDRDNLVASFKPVLDALKSQRAREPKVNKSGKYIPPKPYVGRVIADDGPDHVDVTYRQESAPNKVKFITVKVEAINQIPKEGK